MSFDSARECPAQLQGEKQMVRKTTISYFLGLAALAIFVLLIAPTQNFVAAQSGPALATNKTAYIAGETITITGSGFASYENITLQIAHATATGEASDLITQLAAAAGADGTFTVKWSIDPYDTSLHFIVTAASSSGLSAQVTFTRVGSISTDKPGYLFGDTATIKGSGFLPGEIVTVKIKGSNTGAGSDGGQLLTATSDQNGKISASSTMQPQDFNSVFYLLTAEGTTSGILASEPITIIPPNFFYVIDQQGANDNPGQKDLTMMGRDDSDTEYLKVFWNWDDVDFQSQTGDACALFDSDGDGNINLAVCGEVQNGPGYTSSNPVILFVSVKAYSCLDSRNDRCASPIEITNLGLTTAGQLGSVDPLANLVTYLDPFPTGSYSPKDTTLQVNIDRDILASFPGATLVNVCTYPSKGAGGNNDPSDCTTTKGGGFLRIIKDAGSDTTTDFVFSVSPIPVGQVSSYTITGTGQVSAIGFEIGNAVSVDEALPPGWDFGGASCVIQTDPTNPTITVPTGTLDFANQKVTGIEIQSGKLTICTFTNTPKPATLTVIKHVVNDNGGTAVASDFTINVTGDNANPASFSGSESGTTVTLRAGSYSVNEIELSGYTAGYSADCSGSLGPGETKTCTITNNDKAPSLIVIKHVINDNGGTKTAANFPITVTGNSPSPASFQGAESPGTTVAIKAGSFSVTETPDPGYTASYSGCTGDIALGETKTCTITNDDKAPSLIVIKHVINDNGGTKTAANFPITVTGNSPSPASFQGEESPGTTVAIKAGSFGVTETPDPGYAVTYSGCAGTIGLGETKTCTITNDDKAPFLIVIKHVINDNGGSKMAQDFPITVSGNSPSPTAFAGAESPGTTVAIKVGSFSVTETPDPGYAASYSGCTGTIALGETKTCTITNDDIGAQLIVIKHVINDNGGTATASDFSMNVAGNNPNPSFFPGVESPGTIVSLNPGSYSVTESGPSGYLSSGGCSGSIALGQVKTCTIINNDIAPHLIVIKHVINDNGGTAVASNFTMSVTGSSPSPASFPGAESPGTDVTIHAGSYSVSESGPSGYGAGYSDDCAGTISVGETRTCTVTNNDFAAQLIVIKHVINDNGGTAAAADFTMQVSGTSVIPGSFAGAESGTQVTLDAGSYSVTESGPSGYASDFSADCTGIIGVGQTKTCTITNNDMAPQLKVIKLVVNDNGGRAVSSAFTMHVMRSGADLVTPFAGTISGTTNTFDAGTYSVTENGPSGYAASYSENCSGTIAVGEIKICTVTNNDIAPKLTLRVDQVVNDNGGTAVKDDWTLSASGPTPISGLGSGVTSLSTFEAGTYSLSDSGPAGYARSGWVCTGTGLTVNSANSITLGLAADVTCVISFDDIAPKLTVKKFLFPGINNPDQFILNVSETHSDPGGNGTTLGPLTLNAGQTYSVFETPGSGVLLTDYKTTISCTNGASAAGYEVPVTLALGDDVTCTISNIKIGTIFHEVTDSSLCPLPDKFNLLFIQDAPTTFRLNASNPGQFYDNIIIVPGGGTVDFDINIPYPFITQGAVPIQVHSMFSLPGACFVPGPDVTGSFIISTADTHRSPSDNPIIGLDVYGNNYMIDPANVTTVHISGSVPDTGIVYITIHLDYGLKQSSPWSPAKLVSSPGGSHSTATNLITGTKIAEPQSYSFWFTESENEITESETLVKPESSNTFKQNPGFSGLVMDSGQPVPDALVTISGAALPVPGGSTTVKTDPDGWYAFPFKYTGKATQFKVEYSGQEVYVTLKSNGLAVVNFPTAP